MSGNAIAVVDVDQRTLEAMCERTALLDAEWFQAHPWADHFRRPLEDDEVIRWCLSLGIPIEGLVAVVVSGWVVVRRTGQRMVDGRLEGGLRIREYHHVAISALEDES